MAADDVVGSASVEITPEFDAFERALREGVEGGLERSRAQVKKLDGDLKGVSKTVGALGKQIRHDISFEPQLKQVNLLGKGVSKLSREVRNLSIQVSAELTTNVNRLKKEFDQAANNAERMNKAIRSAVAESKNLKNVSVDFKVSASLSEISKLKTEIKTSSTEAKKLRTDIDLVGTSATTATTKVRKLTTELTAAAKAGDQLRSSLSSLASGDLDKVAAGLSRGTLGAQRLQAGLAAVSAEAKRARKEIDLLSASVGSIPKNVSVNVSSTGGASKTAGAAASSKSGSAVTLGLVAGLVQAKLLRAQTLDTEDSVRRTLKLRKEAAGETDNGPGPGTVPRGGPVGPTVSPADSKALKDFNDELDRTDVLRKRLLRPASDFSVIDVSEVLKETEAINKLAKALQDLSKTNLANARAEIDNFLDSLRFIDAETARLTAGFEDVGAGRATLNLKDLDAAVEGIAGRLATARAQSEAYLGTLKTLKGELAASGNVSQDFIDDLDAQIAAGERAAAATDNLAEREGIARKSANLLAGVEDMLREQYKATTKVVLDTAQGTLTFGDAADDAADKVRRLQGDAGSLDLGAVAEGFKSAWGWLKRFGSETAAVVPSVEKLVGVLSPAERALQNAAIAARRLDFGEFDLSGAERSVQILEELAGRTDRLTEAELEAAKAATTRLSRLARVQTGPNTTSAVSPVDAKEAEAALSVLHTSLTRLEADQEELAAASARYAAVLDSQFGPGILHGADLVSLLSDRLIGLRVTLRNLPGDTVGIGAIASELDRAQVAFAEFESGLGNAPRNVLGDIIGGTVDIDEALASLRAVENVITDLASNGTLNIVDLGKLASTSALVETISDQLKALGPEASAVDFDRVFDARSVANFGNGLSGLATELADVYAAADPKALERFNNEAARGDQILEGNSLNPALGRTSEVLRRVHVDAAGAEGAFGALGAGIGEVDHQLELLRTRLYGAEIAVDGYRDALDFLRDEGQVGLADDFHFNDGDVERATSHIVAFQRELGNLDNSVLQIETDFDALDRSLGSLGLELDRTADDIPELAGSLREMLRSLDYGFTEVIEDAETLYDTLRAEDVAQPFLDMRDALEGADNAVRELDRAAAILTDRSTGAGGVQLVDVARIAELKGELSDIERQLVQLGAAAGEAFADLNSSAQIDSGDAFETLSDDIDSLLNKTEGLREGFNVLGEEVNLIDHLDLADPLVKGMRMLGEATSSAEVALVKLVNRSDITLKSPFLDALGADLRIFAQQLSIIDAAGTPALQHLEAGFNATRYAINDFADEMGLLQSAAFQAAGQLDIFGNEAMNVAGEFQTLIAPAREILKLIDRISAASEGAFGVNFLAPTPARVAEALRRAGDELDKIGQDEADSAEGVETSLRRQIELTNQLTGRYAQQLDIVERINRELNQSGGGAQSPRNIGTLRQQAGEVQAHNEGIDLSRQNATVTEANRLLAEMDALLGQNAQAAEEFGRAIRNADAEFEENSLNPDLRSAIELLGGYAIYAQRGQLSSEQFGRAVGILSAQLTELNATLEAEMNFSRLPLDEEFIDAYNAVEELIGIADRLRGSLSSLNVNLFGDALDVAEVGLRDLSQQARDTFDDLIAGDISLSSLHEVRRSINEIDYGLRSLASGRYIETAFDEFPGIERAVAATARRTTEFVEQIDHLERAARRVGIEANVAFAGINTDMAVTELDKIVNAAARVQSQIESVRSERLTLPDAASLETAVEIANDRLSELRFQIVSLDDVGTFLPFVEALKDVRDLLRSVQGEVLFLSTQGVEGGALTSLIEQTNRLEALTEGLNTSRLREFDTLLDELNASASGAADEIERIRFDDTATLGAVSRVINKIEAAQTEVGTLTRKLFDFNPAMAAQGDLADELANVGERLRQVDDAAENLRRDLGAPFTFDLLSRSNEIQATLEEILRTGRRLTSEFQIGDVGLLHETEAALGGIGRQLLELNADAAGQFGNELSDSFDPRFVLQFGRALYGVELQVQNLQEHLSLGPVALLSDVLNDATQTVGVFAVKLIDLGQAFGTLEVHLATLEARGLPAVAGGAGKLATQSIRDVITNLERLVTAIDETRAVMDRSDGQIVDLDHAFGSLTGHVLDGAEAFREIIGVAATTERLAARAGEEIAASFKSSDLDTFADQVTKTLRRLDNASANVEGVLGFNLLAPTAEQVTFALEEAGRALEVIGRAESEVDLEGSLRRQVEEADRLAGRLADVSDILGRIDAATGAVPGASIPGKSLASLSAERDIVNTTNLERQNQVLADGVSVLDDLDRALAEAEAGMDALRRSAEGLEDELEGRSLTPAVRRLGDALQGARVEMAGFEGSFGAVESAAGMLDRQLGGLRTEMVAIGAAAREGADIDVLLFQLDELEEKVTAFKSQSARGNRPLIGDTNKLLADVYDLGEAIDKVGDTAIVSFKAAGRAAAQLNEAVGPSPDIERAIPLLDRLGLAGTRAGKLLLEAGRNFHKADGETQALAVSIARLVGTRDLLVASFDRLPLFDPKAAGAFDAFAKDIKRQFAEIGRAGVKVRPQDTDPFPSHKGTFGSIERGKLPVLSTESTGAHQLLTDIQNDMFRAVHDYFEHFLIKADFSRKGEEAAFQIGREQFQSKDARRAFATETRGQNANLIRRGSFPDQKAGLLPDSLIGEERSIASRRLALPPLAEISKLTTALREQKDLTADDTRIITGLLGVLAQLVTESRSLEQATAAETALLRQSSSASLEASAGLGVFTRQVDAADYALEGGSLNPALRELLSLMSEIPGMADRDEAAFGQAAAAVESLDLNLEDAYVSLKELVAIGDVGGLIDSPTLGLVDARAAKNALDTVTLLRKGFTGLGEVKLASLERSLGGISDRTLSVKSAASEAFDLFVTGQINASTAIGVVGQGMAGLAVDVRSATDESGDGVADLIKKLRAARDLADTQLAALPDKDPLELVGGMGVERVRGEVLQTKQTVLDLIDAARRLPDAFSGRIVDSLRNGLEGTVTTALDLRLALLEVNRVRAAGRSNAPAPPAIREPKTGVRIGPQGLSGSEVFDQKVTQRLFGEAEGILRVVGGLQKSLQTIFDFAPTPEFAGLFKAAAAEVRVALVELVESFDAAEGSLGGNEIALGLVGAQARLVKDAIFDLDRAVETLDYNLEEGSLNPSLERTFELLREVQAEARDSDHAIELFGRAVFETDDDLDAMASKLRDVNDRLGNFKGSNLSVGDAFKGFSGQDADLAIAGLDALEAATIAESSALEKMIKSIRTGKNAFEEMDKAATGALDARTKLAEERVKGNPDLQVVHDVDEQGRRQAFIQNKKTGQRTNPNVDPRDIEVTQERLLKQFADLKIPDQAKSDLADFLSDMEKLVGQAKVARERVAEFKFTTPAPRLDSEVDVFTKLHEKADYFFDQLRVDLSQFAEDLDNVDDAALDGMLRDVIKLLERINGLNDGLVESVFELNYPSDDLYQIEGILEQIYTDVERVRDTTLIDPYAIQDLHDLISEAAQFEDAIRGADLSGVVSDDLVRKLGLGDSGDIADEVNRLGDELDDARKAVEALPDELIGQLADELDDLQHSAYVAAGTMSDLASEVNDLATQEPPIVDQRTIRAVAELNAEIKALKQQLFEAIDVEHQFQIGLRGIGTSASNGALNDFANATTNIRKELRDAEGDFDAIVYNLKQVAHVSPDAAAALNKLGNEIRGADDELETNSLNPSLRKLLGLLKDVSTSTIDALTSSFKRANKASEDLAGGKILPGKKSAPSTALVPSGTGGGGFDPLIKKSEEFDKSLKKVEKSSRSVKDRLRNLLQLGAAGLGFQQVGKFLLDALNETRDLGEAVNKINVVFGDASAAVKEFAQSAVTTIGQSQKQTLNAVGTFGNLFTSLGVNKDLAADLSLNMTKLASDVSSFANIPIDDALEKFRSGLSGEFEPLKGLGIAINEVALEQEALKLGFKKTGDTLDPAVKALATYNLILKNTKNAQGDFARTSQSLANQQRILTAEFSEAKLEIGAELLPVALELIHVLRDNIGTFKEIALTIAHFAAVLVTSLIPAMRGVLVVLQLVTKALEALGPAGTTALVAFAGFYKLRSILGGTTREFERLRTASSNFSKLNEVDPKQFGPVANTRGRLEAFSATKKAIAAEAKESASSIAKLNASIQSAGGSGAGAGLAKVQKGFERTAAAATTASKVAGGFSKAMGSIGSALPIIGAAFSFLAVAQGVYEEKLAKQKAVSLDAAAAIAEDNKQLIAQGKILDSTNLKFGTSVRQQALDFLAKDVKESGGDLTKALGEIGDKIAEVNSKGIDKQKFATPFDIFRIAAAGAGKESEKAIAQLLELEALSNRVEFTTSGGPVKNDKGEVIGSQPTLIEKDPKKIAEITAALDAQGQASRALSGDTVTLADGTQVYTKVLDSKLLPALGTLNTAYNAGRDLINAQTKAGLDDQSAKKALSETAKVAGVSQDTLNSALAAGADVSELAGLNADELRKRLTGVAGASLALDQVFKKFAKRLEELKGKFKEVVGPLEVSGKAQELAKKRQDAFTKSIENQKAALDKRKTALEAQKAAAEKAVDAQIAAIQKLNEAETKRVEDIKALEDAAREAFSTFVGQIDAFQNVVSDAAGAAAERLQKSKDEAQKAIDEIQKKLDDETNPRLIESLNAQLDKAKKNLESLPETADATLSDFNDVITKNLTETASFVANLNVLIGRGATDLAAFLAGQGTDAAAALAEAAGLSDAALAKQEEFIDASKAQNAQQKQEVTDLVDFLDGVTTPELNLIPEPDKESITAQFDSAIQGIDNIIAQLDAQAAAATAIDATATADDFLTALNNQETAAGAFFTNLQLLRDNDLGNLADFFAQQGLDGAAALQALVTAHQDELNAKLGKNSAELAQQDQFAKDLKGKYDQLILQADQFAADFAAAGAKAGESFRLDLISALNPQEIAELIGKLQSTTGLASGEISRFVLQSAGLDVAGLSADQLSKTLTKVFGGELSKVFESIKQQGLAATNRIFTDPVYQSLVTGGFGFGAEGGYYSTPTQLIIGEAGPEVLLPLSNPQRALDLAKSSGLFGVLAKASGFGATFGANGAQVGGVDGAKVEQTHITIESLIVQVTPPAGTRDAEGFGGAVAVATANRLRAIAAIRAS